MTTVNVLGLIGVAMFCIGFLLWRQVCRMDLKSEAAELCAGGAITCIVFGSFLFAVWALYRHPILF